MPRKSESPSMKMRDDGRERVYSHPAFGCVSMSVVTGGHETMFGSDLMHGQRIRIRVRQAEQFRTLSSDWHMARKSLIEFDMSHAQFAELITASGRSEGVPCTLYEVGGETMPEILPLESKQETMRREVRDAAAERVRSIAKDVAALGELIESGKIGKVTLKELHRSLASKIASLPTSMEFVVGMAEETIDNATNQAKIEIQATITHHVSSLGQEAAKALGLASGNASPGEILIA